jgi:hypothetical protein
VMRRFITIVGTTLLCAVPSLGWASPITYVGKDVGVGYGGPFANSDAAHAAFVAAVTNPNDTVHTIDFETAPLGAFVSLAVGAGVTATFTNQAAVSGISNQDPSSLGTFDTTRPGTKYILMDTPSVRFPNTTTTVLTFSFAQGIDSFGAYIAGLGNDAPFSYQFNDTTGQLTLNSSGLSNGFNEVQFFGFTDFGSAINSVAINVTEIPADQVNSWNYAVGVDDVTFSNPVPEPATLTLLGAGLLAIARRRIAARRG